MKFIRNNLSLVIAAIALVAFAFFAFAKPALRKRNIIHTDNQIAALISGSSNPSGETTQGNLHQVIFEVKKPSYHYAQMASGSAESWVFNGITYSRMKMEDGFAYSSLESDMQRIIRVGMKNEKSKIAVLAIWN